VLQEEERIPAAGMTTKSVDHLSFRTRNLKLVASLVSKTTLNSQQKASETSCHSIS
jgi:hypothetical protein